MWFILVDYSSIWTVFYGIEQKDLMAFKALSTQLRADIGQGIPIDYMLDMSSR